MKIRSGGPEKLTTIFPDVGLEFPMQRIIFFGEIPEGTGISGPTFWVFWKFRPTTTPEIPYQIIFDEFWLPPKFQSDGLEFPDQILKIHEKSFYQAKF